MKRVAAIAAVALLAGCATDPNGVAGIVTDMEYDDPDTTTKSCDPDTIGCVGGIKQEKDPAHWTLWVGNRSTYVISVTEQVYDECRIGARFEGGRCIG